MALRPWWRRWCGHRGDRWSRRCRGLESIIPSVVYCRLVEGLGPAIEVGRETYHVGGGVSAL
jgi:hypothetical protein